MQSQPYFLFAFRRHDWTQTKTEIKNKCSSLTPVPFSHMIIPWCLGLISKPDSLLLQMQLPLPGMGFPAGSVSKHICLQCRRPELDPWVRKIPWRRKWQPTLVFLPGKSTDTGVQRARVTRLDTRVGHDWGLNHHPPARYRLSPLSAYSGPEAIIPCALHPFM